MEAGPTPMPLAQPDGATVTVTARHQRPLRLLPLVCRGPPPPPGQRRRRRAAAFEVGGAGALPRAIGLITAAGGHERWDLDHPLWQPSSLVVAAGGFLAGVSAMREHPASGLLTAGAIKRTRARALIASAVSTPLTGCRA